MAAISVLLIVAVVVTIVLVNAARQQAQAKAAATAAVVTSTAAANATYAAVPLAVYSAPIPGTCANNPNNSILIAWQSGPSVTETCTAAGDKVTNNGGPIPGSFDGPAFLTGDPLVDFAFSYRVDVDISQLSSHSCAGIQTTTRFNSATTDSYPGNSYDFLVCDDGSWEIEGGVLGASPNMLLSGKVAASSTYHLTVVVGSNKQALSINGGPMRTATDSRYAGTGLVELGVEPARNAISGNTATWATFSNFVYTPLLFTPSH